MTRGAGAPPRGFVPDGPWPWSVRGVRVLPVLHGRLETARAVRALLDAEPPGAVVVEVPAPLAAAWLEAVRGLPRISALRVDDGGAHRWLLVEPTDGIVEAARWALDRGLEPLAADLLLPAYPDVRERTPDPGALPAIGYDAFVRAWLHTGPRMRTEADEAREAALAAAALGQAESGREVALVCGLAHLDGVLRRLEAGEARGAGVVPLRRPFSGTVEVRPLHPDALGETMTEVPFIAAAWERARSGGDPADHALPAPPPRTAEVLSFDRVRPATARGDAGGVARAGDPAAAPGPGSPRATAAGPEPGADLPEGRSPDRPDDDPLDRGALCWALAVAAERFHAQEGGAPPSLPERRVLHRFARAMAIVDGRLHPGLYELVAAARGAVDDRYARDTHRVATHWPWPVQPAHGVRLTAADLGAARRIVRLRPRIDRLARRRGLVRAWRREGPLLLSPTGLCSHTPEDLVVEALGEGLRATGAARAARARRRSVPFTSSLLDGLDARETLRRFVADGRPWVREEVRGRGTVGAVVVIFDPDDGPEETYPWREVWYGEHDNESDMALYATDPDAIEVVPGIRRAEYGGFMMSWPPRRLGDVWHDPAYAALAATKPERLLVAALDYSLDPLVVHVARRPPRERMHALARRLGRRIVHLPPGVLPRDRLRRVRTVHVLAGRHLRPIAEALVDPA